MTRADTQEQENEVSKYLKSWDTTYNDSTYSTYASEASIFASSEFELQKALADSIGKGEHWLAIQYKDTEKNDSPQFNTDQDIKLFPRIWYLYQVLSAIDDDATNAIRSAIDEVVHPLIELFNKNTSMTRRQRLSAAKAQMTTLSALLLCIQNNCLAINDLKKPIVTKALCMVLESSELYLNHQLSKLDFIRKSAVNILLGSIPNQLRNLLKQYEALYKSFERSETPSSFSSTSIDSGSPRSTDSPRSFPTDDTTYPHFTNAAAAAGAGAGCAVSANEDKQQEISDDEFEELHAALLDAPEDTAYDNLRTKLKAYQRILGEEQRKWYNGYYPALLTNHCYPKAIKQLALDSLRNISLNDFSSVGTSKSNPLTNPRDPLHNILVKALAQGRLYDHIRQSGIINSQTGSRLEQIRALIADIQTHYSPAGNGAAPEHKAG